MVTTDSRGQAYTLEALVSALLLLGAVIFALQATAVTPQSATTADEHSQEQLEQVGNGVLDAAAEDGAIRRTVLYWDNSTGTFHGLKSYEAAYTNAALPTAFGDLLAETFASQAIAYNVNVRYSDSSGSTATQRILDSGTPSDDAVVVTELVTLYDDDLLYTESENPGSTTVSEAAFYAPDSDPDSGVYNVVAVEVVLWST